MLMLLCFTLAKNNIVIILSHDNIININHHVSSNVKELKKLTNNKKKYRLKKWHIYTYKEIFKHFKYVYCATRRTLNQVLFNLSVPKHWFGHYLLTWRWFKDYLVTRQLAHFHFWHYLAFHNLKMNFPRQLCCWVQGAKHLPNNTRQNPLVVYWSYSQPGTF